MGMGQNESVLGKQPQIIVCPGSHPPAWTEQWRQALTAIAPELTTTLAISPATPPWAGHPLRQWLMALLAEASTPPLGNPTQPPSDQPLGQPPTVQPLIYMVAFSAGCVAAEAIAHYAPHGGYRIGAIFAWDGWGVPLVGPFPVHRLSHDGFTHYTSYRPGGKRGDGPRPALGHRPHFYADPTVPHHQLWQAPHQVQGWQVGDFTPQPSRHRHRTTALAFQLACFHHYGLYVPTLGMSSTQKP